MVTKMSIVVLLITAGCAARDATPRDTWREQPQARQRITATEVAELMASSPGELKLNNLKALDTRVAQQLARYRGWLFLDGLSTITEDDAQILVESDSIIGLSLGGLSDLTPRLATVLANKHGTLMLDGLRHISDETGRALATHQGVLSLKGLEDLSQSLIDAFSEHAESIDLEHIRRNVLELNDVRLASLLARGALGLGEFACLKTLTADAAEAVGRHSGSLSLPELKTLSAEAARGLVQTKYSLFLPGVEAIDEATAKELSVSRDALPDLFLNGLRSITPEVAYWLGRKRGALILNGIEALTPDAAKYLADHTGGPLMLNGIDILTPEVATQLTRKTGWMFLGCTDNMDPETARILTSGTGYVGISFTRLASMSDKLAESLVANLHCFIDLPALSGDSISPSVSTVLANARCGLLQLSGITTLSTQLARDIGFYNCRLELTNLDAITPEHAALLAVNKSHLELPLITSLPEEAAISLAGHRGTLVLHAPSSDLLKNLVGHEGTLWLKSPTHQQRSFGRQNYELLNSLIMTPPYYEALSGHKGPIVLQDVTRLSETAALALAQRNSATDLTWLEYVSPGPGLQALKASKKVVLSEDLRK